MDTSKKNTSKVAKLILFSIIFMSLSNLSFAEKCPQTRKTPTAPQNFLSLQNPLPLNAKNLKSAEKLFQEKAKPIACKFCHGTTGNGEGDPDFESTPSARNFTCSATMNKLPDGQLFWIIKNGSKNTSMFSFSDLSDNQIWQLVHYIRAFGK
ncbi:c-type cytochrome [Nitrospinae bacterium]|nr:c-type cytochrome [Nitrospinota bacterium]